MWIKTRVAIKRGKAPGRDCGWRRRLRLSIESPGQCQSQDMSPAVVCFLRIPLHSWVYSQGCLLTGVKGASGSGVDVDRRWQRAGTDGRDNGVVVTVATVSRPSRLTPVRGPGVMGSFQKLIHLHALPWPRGSLTTTGITSWPRNPPRAPLPPIPMLDRSADGMHPAGGGGFFCVLGSENLLEGSRNLARGVILFCLLLVETDLRYLSGVLFTFSSPECSVSPRTEFKHDQTPLLFLFNCLESRSDISAQYHIHSFKSPTGIQK